MSKKKETIKVVENSVVVAIKDAVTAVREAVDAAKESNYCPEAISTRLENLRVSVMRTGENAVKRMVSAAKKAERDATKEATKGERKEKLLEKIKTLQAKADAIS